MFKQPLWQTVWTQIRLLLLEQSVLDPRCLLLYLISKVSKGAKIRNRYNQVPHLTQDTNGKVTNSQLDTTKESHEVSPFPAGNNRQLFAADDFSRRHFQMQFFLGPLRVKKNSYQPRQRLVPRLSQPHLCHHQASDHLEDPSHQVLVLLSCLLHDVDQPGHRHNYPTNQNIFFSSLSYSTSVQGCHSILFSKFPDFSLTFP